MKRGHEEREATRGQHEEKRSKNSDPGYPDDWSCEACDETNFTRRTTCRKCNMPHRGGAFSLA
jgi:ribosomal protein L37AE/L43A